MGIAHRGTAHPLRGVQVLQRAKVPGLVRWKVSELEPCKAILRSGRGQGQERELQALARALPVPRVAACGLVRAVILPSEEGVRELG